MSGPTTAILIADPVAVLLSAAGIRAVMAVREGYQQSAELAQRHQSERSEHLKQQQAAIQQGQAAQHQQMEQAEAEFRHLLLVSERMGAAQRIQSGRPAPIDDDSATSLRTLQAYNAEIKAILMTQFASQPDWENTLPEFTSGAEDAEPQTVVARNLARIAHLGAIPEPIQILVGQLAQPLPLQRQEILQNELRRQVQLHLEQTQQQAVQEASALILSHTLKELGYQVQEFSDTLFVEGGVVHFRRHEWGDYMVRLRLNEKTNTVNFNVIRAVKNADNERSVLDHLAEDRWCAEFPALLKAMEARGLSLNVTRRLEAGELPVQLVDSSLLPNFTEAETRHSDAVLKQRHIDDK